MIKINNIKDIDIISYIGNDYDKCLYLYLDYKRYGLTDKNVEYFVEKDEKENIICLVMKYYDSLHIYSKNNNYCYNELKEFILEINPSFICGEKSIIEKLSKDLDYETSYGYVRKLVDIDENIDNIALQIALEDDFFEITKLLKQDEQLSGYINFNQLYNQLLCRFKEKYCRNYIYKLNDKIIGHVCSGAEDNNIVILTDLIVDKEYRGQGIGKKICKSFCEKMMMEKKDVYLINYTDLTNNLYKKVGFEIMCNWGKMYRNK